MTLTIKADKNLHIQIPTGLALNGLTAIPIAHQLRKQGMNVRARQIRTLFRAIMQYRRNHREWILVEVQSADEENIRICL